MAMPSGGAVMVRPNRGPRRSIVNPKNGQHSCSAAARALTVLSAEMARSIRTPSALGWWRGGEADAVRAAPLAVIGQLVEACLCGHQGLPRLRELGDAVVDLVELAAQEGLPPGLDVGAGIGLPHRHQGGDLLQGQVQLLGGTDEPESLEGIGIEDPVPVGSALGMRQAEVLVVAQGRRRYTAACGDLGDAHRVHVSNARHSRRVEGQDRAVTRPRRRPKGGTRDSPRAARTEPCGSGWPTPR